MEKAEASARLEALPAGDVVWRASSDKRGQLRLSSGPVWWFAGSALLSILYNLATAQYCMRGSRMQKSLRVRKNGTTDEAYIYVNLTEAIGLRSEVVGMYE